MGSAQTPPARLRGSVGAGGQLLQPATLMIDDDARDRRSADGRAGRQGGGRHRGRAGDRREEALACARAGAAVVVDDLAGAEETAAAVAAEGAGRLALGHDVGDFEAAGWSPRPSSTSAAWTGANNAGVVRDRMVFNLGARRVRPGAWVNLGGTFATTGTPPPGGRPSRQGAIVNTTSTSGILGNLGQSNYGAPRPGWPPSPSSAPWSWPGTGPGERHRPRGPHPDDRGAFGQLDFEGEFDPLDPANVAPVVVWLLSDAAAEVSGQVIGITGGLVELYEGWHVVATEELPRRWTPEEWPAPPPAVRRPPDPSTMAAVQPPPDHRGGPGRSVGDDCDEAAKVRSFVPVALRPCRPLRGSSAASSP